MSTPRLLEFPCDYPLKVIGRRDAGFRARVHAIVLRHAPALAEAEVSERPSANGAYTCISYRLRAESRAQVEALVTELKGCEGVLLLL